MREDRDRTVLEGVGGKPGLLAVLFSSFSSTLVIS